jgi:hypothetical protein
MGVGLTLGEVAPWIRTLPVEGVIFSIIGHSVLVLTAALIAACIVNFVLPFAVRTFIKLFANERPGHSLRKASVLALIIGFHFDFLAS